ncbi:sulfate adenylyltransferase [Candidatus Nitrososphaera gargensis Ga9.2]|uniref:Sulfate adenylyltransferase n=1 Tax=Nitrososphaera gargensis (strain Ga9.2) TaxID=1237085 RepID=K0I9E9_NITGG|nr:sulfate adenylyltransferase [Candidatus Nitrososphaera gargensis]AFU57971.1 sulfate adenylyltransferase [Candidatus Nitrososphaera gargensis Ga9.2]
MLAGSIPLPHGGRLVNRFVASDKKTDGMFTVSVSDDLRNDIENIADGIFSPLEGFVGEQDFQSIVKAGRLKNGLAWTVPIVLDVDEQTAVKMKDAGQVALATGSDRFAILHVEETYAFDKLACAKAIYQTDDTKHPGVDKMIRMKDRLVGGKIDVVKRIEQSPLRKYRMTPAETRAEISRKGWKSVVGFQTRNVPHVAHEMLQKAALNLYDGLFVNPLIGKKKQGDFKDEVILAAYVALIDEYYPKDRTMFVTLHTEMRYAGPKEAIHHAIMRKNFGCSNFIVGRDHAGVSNYYHPFAAHEIFKNYMDLGIEPVFFPAFYYCKKCLSYANERNCPHGQEFREELSGTKMRNMVSSGEIPAEHLMRPEVAKTIISFNEPFVQ